MAAPRYPIDLARSNAWAVKNWRRNRSNWGFASATSAADQKLIFEPAVKVDASDHRDEHGWRDH
jgi:hypothetical protein